MHEYSLVQDLLEQVATHARERGATGVVAITVGLGELAGVDPDLFATAFETFRAVGACGEAVLTVRLIDARWVCDRCQHPLERGAVLQCPACGGPGRLDAGGDLLLERIELEVPEPHPLRTGPSSGAAAAE